MTKSAFFTQKSFELRRKKFEIWLEKLNRKQATTISKKIQFRKRYSISIPVSPTVRFITRVISRRGTILSILCKSTSITLWEIILVLNKKFQHEQIYFVDVICVQYEMMKAWLNNLTLLKRKITIGCFKVLR